MNDVLGQNVEILSDVDSTAKEETKGRKLKLHDVTYEKLTGFRKIFAQMNIKSEINDEVRDYSVDNDQEHLDKISVLMSQYKFLDDGIEESPEYIARRAIRLNEQMIYDAKLNAKIIKAMLEKERVNNVSAIDEDAEEQLVNAINQRNDSEPVASDAVAVDQSDLIQQIDDTIGELKAVDGVPAIEPSGEVSLPVSDETVVDQPVDSTVGLSDQDFAPLFDETHVDEPADVHAEEEQVVTDSPEVDNSSLKGIQPMTDEEIEESRELLRRTAPREDARRFSFEDIFGPNNDIVPTNNGSKDVEEGKPEGVVNNDEEAFLEVNNLLQEADDLLSRGSKAEEEREKAVQRRKTAGDRRQQADQDEAMKKAALADAIAEYKAYVAELKENESATLKDIESANAAADLDEEATRAAEERSAYTQQVIDSLLSSMGNKPKKRK